MIIYDVTTQSQTMQAEGNAAAIVARGKAQAEAQEAFDQRNPTYFFIPMGKDGLPLMLNVASSTPNR